MGMNESDSDCVSLQAGNRVMDLLAQHWIITLSCHDKQGCWASAVFYASDGFDLYYLSSPSSRHSTSLAFDNRLAGAIHHNATDWTSIVGLQVSGTATVLDHAEAENARQLYERRFPFIANAHDEAGDLSRALRRTRCYRLSLDRAVVIDNARGFGQRMEWLRA